MNSASMKSQEELYLELVLNEKHQWKQARDELRTKPPFECFQRTVSAKETGQLGYGRNEDLATLMQSVKLALSDALSAIDRVTVLKEQYNMVRATCDLARKNCSRLTEKYHEEIGHKNPLLKHCFQSRLKRDIMCTESEPPILKDE